MDISLNVATTIALWSKVVLTTDSILVVWKLIKIKRTQVLPEFFVYEENDFFEAFLFYKGWKFLAPYQSPLSMLY